MKKYLFICFTLLLGSFISAQDGNKMLKVKDMRADIDFYFSSLKDVHPNPFSYISENEFQSKVDSIKDLITKPLNKKEFYHLVVSLNKYTDLHTRIVPSKKMIRKETSTFLYPNISECHDTVFILLKDNTKARLLSVNGANVQTIKRFYVDNISIVEPIHNYNFLDALNFYKDVHFWNNQLTFVCLNENKQTDTIVVYALGKAFNGKGKRICNLVCDSAKSIAVLELNTFMPYKTNEQLKFTKTISNIFDTLNGKHIKRLYIDLTANNGGLIAFEEYLLNFLLTTNNTINLWDLTLKKSNQRNKQRGYFASSSNADYYQKQHLFTPAKVKNKFKGEVFIIQSRHSFSAACTLASQLRKFRACKIIGEECQAKAVYTDPILLQLPNSKFMFSCATGFIKNVGKDKTRGVIPDIPCEIYNIYDDISVEKAEQMRLNIPIQQ